MNDQNELYTEYAQRDLTPAEIKENRRWRQKQLLNLILWHIGFFTCVGVVIYFVVKLFAGV